MLELPATGIDISLLLIAITNLKIKESKTYKRPPFLSFCPSYHLLLSKRQAPDMASAYVLVV
jgi:hypothetical protein